MTKLIHKGKQSVSCKIYVKMGKNSNGGASRSHLEIFAPLFSPTSGENTVKYGEYIHERSLPTVFDDISCSMLFMNWVEVWQ